MPKLIDYPRTGYAGAWEVADVVNDTGGKCALETCARKLNRKVSGSFKAIVGSAVKFGLLTSKREMLTTTTLFRRIKHAYDKQEELLFHREAFLTPPLFTQLCRKFRSRELPVQMLDIMLIREFDVEEINAQGVAKAFVDGARMVGLLDERQMVADIDQLAAQQPPRRELASPELGANSFRAELARSNAPATPTASAPLFAPGPPSTAAPAGTGPEASARTKSAGAQGPDAPARPNALPPIPAPPLRGADAVASLFGLGAAADDNHASRPDPNPAPTPATPPGNPRSQVVFSPNAGADGPAEGQKPSSTSALGSANTPSEAQARSPNRSLAHQAAPLHPSAGDSPAPAAAPLGGFRIELSGPGINTVLEVQDEDDLALARFLLDKIGRQLKR